MILIQRMSHICEDMFDVLIRQNIYCIKKCHKNHVYKALFIIYRYDIVCLFAFLMDAFTQKGK